MYRGVGAVAEEHDSVDGEREHQEQHHGDVHEGHTRGEDEGIHHLRDKLAVALRQEERRRGHEFIQLALGLDLVGEEPHL